MVKLDDDVINRIKKYLFPLKPNPRRGLGLAYLSWQVNYKYFLNMILFSLSFSDIKNIKKFSTKLNHTNCFFLCVEIIALKGNNRTLSLLFSEYYPKSYFGCFQTSFRASTSFSFSYIVLHLVTYVNFVLHNKL